MYKLVLKNILYVILKAKYLDQFKVMNVKKNTTCDVSKAGASKSSKDTTTCTEYK